MMEMFSVLTVSVLISWLGHCIIVSGDATLGELGQGYTGSPYDFLKLNVYKPNNYYKLKILTRHRQMIARICGVITQ